VQSDRKIADIKVASFDRAKPILSGEIRDIIVQETLMRILMREVYGHRSIQLHDAFQSLMFLGPPGVGKTALQYLAACDVAGILSDVLKRRIDVAKISVRISVEEAAQVAEGVVEGKTIPFCPVFTAQMDIWDLVGTPSPQTHYAEVKGVKIPINIWRIDPYLIPFLDFGEKLPIPRFLVLDEFNMACDEVTKKLFQLARGAEIGRVILSPLTVVTLVGNTPESNPLAAEPPAPLIDRSAVFEVTRVSVDGWIAYMNEVYGNRWEHAIAAYLALNPGELYVADWTKPGCIQTPRDWTFVAVRLYSLQLLRNLSMRRASRHLQGTDILRSIAEYSRRSPIVSDSTFWRRVEYIVYSTLTRRSASKLLGFLKGLAALNIDEIIAYPERLVDLEKDVAAYALVTIASRLANEYRSADTGRREWILNKLAELAKYGYKVLGPESLSIILRGLPMPVIIALSRRVPAEIMGRLSEVRRQVEELEEVLAG